VELVEHLPGPIKTFFAIRGINWENLIRSPLNDIERVALLIPIGILS
jgi:hypothetical protein